MRFLKWFGIAIVLALILGSGLLIYALFVEPNQLVVNQYDVSVKSLPSSFEGLKIVAISDLHAGSKTITKSKIQEIVELANKQEPDVIVLLGDFVAQMQQKVNKWGEPIDMPLEEFSPILSGLKAKYGVYAVIGNHDVQFDADAVAQSLSESGLTVLRDEIVDIKSPEGDVLNVFGLIDSREIESQSEYAIKLKNLLAESGTKENLLVLGHNPDIALLFESEYQLANATTLFLAGHTHGGQVWLPIVGSPILLSTRKYPYGHVQNDSFDVFVTTGIGTSIYPIRFLVPPEIAVLTVRKRN